MGNFYVSLSIKGDRAEIVQALQEDAPAVVGPKDGGWVSYSSDLLEEQDEAFIARRAATLSGRLSTAVVGVINHDDDILMIWAFVRGAEMSIFNSFPGYFSGEDTAPYISGVEALSELAVNTSPERLVEVLAKRQRVAINQHASIVSLLGLPQYSVGFGYRYAASGEHGDGLTFL